jgi:hypothetical protein
MFPFPTPVNQIKNVERAIQESKDKIKKENDDKMVYRSSPKIVTSGNYLSSNTEFSLNAMDKLLENEKNRNKTESWNKLDKTVKIQKLHMFAEKYGKEHGFPVKEIKALKMFFNDCLEKNKLNKTKDLVYDKELSEIVSIPSLHFNSTTRNFTLKNIDPKRVSTLKALTPRAFSRAVGTSGKCDAEAEAEAPTTTTEHGVPDEGKMEAPST